MQESESLERDKYAALTPILLGIAHEFRNPVQGILASLAVLRERISEQETITPFLDLIQRDATRISAVIDDFLQLAEPIQFDASPVILSSVVQDALSMVEQKRRSHKATIKVQADIPPFQLTADRHALTLAFRALLVNAIESKAQAASVQLSTDRDEKLVRISIIDNGEGIRPELIPRVLEPFFSTRPKRAGLGLAVAERTIHAHHGRIALTSKQGIGTRVDIELPARED